MSDQRTEYIKKWGSSEEKPPPHELDLFDRYAKGDTRESYSKGWLWAQKLLGLIKKQERREAWDEGAKAMIEYFYSNEYALAFDPPENPYPVEPS